MKELRAAGSAVSGEVLSQRLSVSRVAVWKHVKALQERGYPLVASPSGYVLAGGDDFLYPWEFGPREDRVHYFPEIPSTMDEARRQAFSGCPENTVVIAGRQTAGRGRLSRSWHSGEGGLWFTLVTRPRLPALSAFRVLFAASVCLARLLESECGVPARVKWPNDILVEGIKVCGMLSEIHATGDRVEHLNLGVGLNVNNRPEAEGRRVASLAELAGRTFSRKFLLSAFLDAFLPTIPFVEIRDVMGPWREFSATLGQDVRVATGREEVEGEALDVDEQGGLVVRRPGGDLVTVTCGDCFHQPRQKDE
ncbi:MAG: biotin--[acetyl-CoA-carboxylase] ligase [Pseudomonadota bacterium]